MCGKPSVSAAVLILAAALVMCCIAGDKAEAARVCTFKGIVIDHGWRTMTVKSGDQCAELNVGWRTKYLPNRRPCLGERVAVDFVLEDGFMRATKVVSLSPLPPSMECYPPPPPSGTTCRSVDDDTPTVDRCQPARPICATKPPAHVSDKDWAPGKKEAPAKKVEKPKVEKTKPDKKKPTSTEESGTETAKPPSAGDKPHQTLTGEVVASSPKSISIRVAEEGEAAEVVNIKVGLKTRFVPFRRPAVGEKVKVDFQKENGDKFGSTVQVVQ